MFAVTSRTALCRPAASAEEDEKGVHKGCVPSSSPSPLQHPPPSSGAELICFALGPTEDVPCCSAGGTTSSPPPCRGGRGSERGGSFSSQVLFPFSLTERPRRGYFSRPAALKDYLRLRRECVRLPCLCIFVQSKERPKEKKKGGGVGDQSSSGGMMINIYLLKEKSYYGEEKWERTKKKCLI